MKKIFTSIFALSATCLSAQLQAPLRNPSERNHVSSEEIQAVKDQIGSNQRDVVNLYIDYPVCDEIEQATGGTTQNYLWTFNSNYTAADTNDIIPINYAAIRFTDLVGYTDVNDDPINTYTGLFEYPDNLLLTIDTIYALFSHENNSGQNDSVILELRELNAQGNILPTTPLVWADTTVTNTSLSPGGNWVGTGALALLTIPCGYQTLENQKVGLNFRYVGDKLDTLGLLAGYVPNPNGPASPNDIALKTKFPNNYFRYMIAALNFGIYNTSDIFYTPQPGQDTGYFKIQNWQMWIAATFEDVATSTQEKLIMPLGLEQNYPNPFEFSSSYSFTIKESQNLTLQVSDVNGRIISNKALGHFVSGSYNGQLPSENLSPGAYFYQLIGEKDKSAVRRFIVSK
jgi:hypothetical protein